MSARASLHSCASLRREGRWLEIYELLDVQDFYTSGDVLALAQASCFLGKEERCDELLRSIAAANLNVSELFQLHSVLSAQARRRKEWATALADARRALALAHELADEEWVCDATFAIACCAAEMGDRFRACDLFENVVKNAKATPYRRGLSALNLTWLLWDLGQQDSLLELRPEVPAAYHERVDLALALVRGEDHPLLALTAGPVTALAGERKSIAELLIIAHYVLPSGSRAKLSKSWIVEFLRGHVPDTKTQMLLRMCSSEISTMPSEFIGVSWREEIELAFLGVLHGASGALLTATEAYSGRLNDKLARAKMTTPLIPRWSRLSDPQTFWEKRLAEIFLVPIEKKKNVLCLQGRTLVHSGSPQLEIDYADSPMTLQLLKILAGTLGRRITKRDVHEGLTGNRYNSQLHDQRLHKLLRRTEHRIFQIFQFKPWLLPGDNCVHLTCDIEVMK